MIFENDIAANTVMILRNNWSNGTIIVVDLRQLGLAHFYWATDNEVQQRNVSPEYEIQPGESVYVVADERKNIVILNKNDAAQHVCIEVDVNPVPPSFRPVSATSGF